MNHKIIISVLIFIIFSCKKDDIGNGIETVAGNSYYSDVNEQLRLVYRLDNDSTISIEERSVSVNGPILEEKVGYYTYNHPELELRVQSICDSCFNYFTAIVSNDRRSFSYEIYDMFSSEFKELNFTLID